MAIKKFCRLVLVLVGMLINPFPTCFYPVGAQTSDRIASLINQLGNESAAVRRDAALALSQMGPAAKLAVPHLVALLKDPDKDVRGAAVSALGRIGSEAKAAVPHLIELLKDPGQGVRWAAARVLG